MSSTKKTLLVIGATGLQGSFVLRRLCKHKNNFEVVGLVRNLQEEPAKKLLDEGYRLIQGNLDDVNSLLTAFKGVHDVFAVFNYWKVGREKEIQQGKNVIDAAKQAGVKHIVYSSVGSANQKTGIPHFDSKAEIEEALKASGITYTILRPTFFMENFIRDAELKNDILKNKTLSLPMKPHNKLQLIAVEDIAAFVELAFTKPEEYKNKAIDLAGDELTMEECARILKSKFVEKPLERVAGKDESRMWKWFQTTGYQADINELKRIYPQLTTFQQWVDKHFAPLAGTPA
jgi:uncharacterized protein YbjT (DUF2867 family)